MKQGIFILIAFLVFGCGEDDEKKLSPNSEKKTLIEKLISEVNKNPDSTRLRTRLINTLDSLQMYKEAIAQTDSLLKKDSLDNQLWLMKAQLQEDNKDTTEAIYSYTRALNIYPSADVQLNLANLLAENRNQKAILICNNVRKMNLGRETDANCNFIEGVYYARTGDFKQAILLFDKAINENYTLMEAHMEKGFIYYELKNYKEALKVFETSITVNNMYADAWYWKAKCFEAMGNKSEAIINYQRALGLDKQLNEAAQAVKRLEE